MQSDLDQEVSSFIQLGSLSPKWPQAGRPFWSQEACKPQAPRDLNAFQEADPAAQSSS